MIFSRSTPGVFVLTFPKRGIGQRAPIERVPRVGRTLIVIFIGFLVSIPADVQAQVFTVTNSLDSGIGSLREAMTTANATPNIDVNTPDEIRFSIPGAGPHTIQVLTPLPSIVDPVIIDGYSQPGAVSDSNGPGLPFNGVLQIVLDGSLEPGGVGIAVFGSNSTIQGLVINQFYLDGVQFFSAGSTGNTLIGCFIGTDVTGTVALGNGRNSGGEGLGVRVGGDASLNTIQRNIISGNIQSGLSLDNSGHDNLVINNFIGIDPSGSLAVPNGSSGIVVQSATSHNTIQDNLISGNAVNGIVSFGGANTNTYDGNRIGTDLTGTAAIPNLNEGMRIAGASGDVITHNLVSGNQESGLVLFEPGLVVTDNIVGPDITGTVVLAGQKTGIFVTGDGHQIERNVLAGNGNSGINLVGAASNVIIRDNAIGTDTTGSTKIGQFAHGMFLQPDPLSNILIESNIIAGSEFIGIALSGQGGTLSGITITQNSIFDNGGLGIDLFDGPAGLTPNDPGDADTGPNNFQNFPTFQTVEVGETGDLEITYLVDSIPGNSTYPLTVEFFLADADNEEGLEFLGSSQFLAIDVGNFKSVGLGNATALGVNDASRFVATATDAAGNTSEFSTAAGLVTQDVRALEALYDATDGPNWTNNTNWLSAEPVETWFGVTFSGGSVTGLELGSNGLSGVLPSELGLLTNLTSLSVSNNSLSGPIPPEIGNLSKLSVLVAGNNQLSGSIPVEFGNLSSLIRLLLNDNQLTGEIPSGLGNIAGLRNLDIDGNDFTGQIPSELGDLALLETLTLDRNQLTGPIPTELGNLTNLRILDLDRNQLTGEVPMSFQSLSQLAEFFVDGNALTGLPDLSGLSALTGFHVQDNAFTFGDLEPNAAIPGFVYAPQATFGTASSVTVHEGDAVSLSVTLDGTTNQYQWLHEGAEISGATFATLDLPTAVPTDAGNYVLAATNTLLPGLTLTSKAQALTVAEKRITDITVPDDVVATAGEDVPLQAELSGLYNPSSRLICYRRTGESVYKCDPLVSDGTSNTASIPGSYVSERGTDYYYEFTSSGTTITEPPEDAVSHPFRLSTSFSGIVSPVTFAEATYRMISVPLALTDPSVSAVLPTVSMSPDDRLLRWNETKDDYEEASELTVDFSPGNAFWYISADIQEFRVDGGESVDASSPFAIILPPGWSQIGNPYAFPVSWSTITNASSVDAPVSFNASLGSGDQYRYNVSTLNSWDGYWVNNPSLSVVELLVEPLAAPPGKGNSSALTFAGATYVAQFEATLPAFKLSDSQNYLGLAHDASDAHDAIDFAEAPGIGSHVRLSIIEDGSRMAASFKNSANESGQTWRMELAASLPVALSESGEEIRVRIVESGQLPEGFDLYVFDEDEAARLPIVESSFSINISRSQPVRHIQILAGNRVFASEQTDGAALLPRQIALESNYPNPFSDETRIRYQLVETGSVRLEIYNSLGQRLITLVNAEQNAGWYVVRWDGRSASGQAAASGMYFYRFQAGGVTKTKTMVLVR